MKAVTLVVAGMLTGLSLIVAIGPQNAYVLRQGVRREYVGIVVVICVVSDILLVTAGTAGIGALIESVPRLSQLLRWGGGAYLLGYAVLCFRSALHPRAPREAGDLDRASVVATTFALTWLNPHTYLDTIVMLGTLANQHGPQLRWWFTGGVVLASVVWFLTLGYGAHALAERLSRPATWRVLDTIIGLVMLAVAFRLVAG